MTGFTSKDASKNGPDFLLCTTVLAFCYPGDVCLENFFTTALNIENAPLKTMIDRLSIWAQEKYSLLKLLRRVIVTGISIPTFRTSRIGETSGELNFHH
jgi:hypothetical protein